MTMRMCQELGVLSLEVGQQNAALGRFVPRLTSCLSVWGWGFLLE